MTAAQARLYLGLAAGLCFAGLTYLSLTYLSPGDLRVFDSYPLGYNLNDARAYVGALGAQETAIYTGPFRVLDTAFPLLLAAFLAMVLFDRTRHWSFVAQLLLIVLPGGYLVMDLTENALVAQIVTSDVSALRAEPVNLASRFTVTKFVILTATLVAIGVASVLRAPK